ncbi:MAG: DJ-1/PfpI family protein [Lachnospiraceae bacterium]|nr:DJ-1/PfpI family protein [Lachnospiraceae bacterium]
MKVCAFLAEGYEEVEALAVVDVLRRAGVDVKIVSITGEYLVKSSRGVTIKADVLFDDMNYDDVDALFMPGGLPGADNLYGFEPLRKLITEFNDKGKRLAAVCAAPSIYGRMGLLEGKKATCYPGFEDKLLGANCVKDRVVTDGNITTSRGMGTSVELGLELVRVLIGEDVMNEQARKIQHITE